LTRPSQPGRRENGAGTPTGREVRPAPALGCRPGDRGLSLTLSTPPTPSLLGPAGPNTPRRPTVYWAENPYHHPHDL